MAKQCACRSFYPFFMNRLWIMGSADENPTILDREVDVKLGEANTLWKAILNAILCYYYYYHN